MAPPGKLNREMIVREAIALLNEGGLEAVSLRRIAERLNARAPSLARHVGDKAHLIALLSAAIFGQALEAIPPGLSGDEWLEAFGHAVRRKQSETRDIAALLSTVEEDDAVQEGVHTELQRRMAEAGLTGSQAQVKQAAIQALVTGWMVCEKAPRARQFASHLPTDHAFDDALKALIAGFGPAA